MMGDPGENDRGEIEGIEPGDSGHELTPSREDDLPSPEEIEVLPPEKLKKAKRIISMFQRRSGPLPPPQELAQYNEIDPELSKVIVGQWTSETEFRREMMREDQQLNRELQIGILKTHDRNSLWGLILGFGLALVAILGGIFLASKGRDLTGFFMFFSGLGVLVGAYVYGHRARAKALETASTGNGDEGAAEPD